MEEEKTESLFTRVINRTADLVLLNLLFLLTSLPVITIGPSLTALYSVAFTIGTDRELGIVKPYFVAFRGRFIPAMKVYLIFLAVVAVLGLDLMLLPQLGAAAKLAVGFWVLLAAALLAGAIAFPWLSLSDGTLGNTLKLSVLLGLEKLPIAALLAFLWLLPLLIMIAWPLMLLWAVILLVMIYYSSVAYLGAWLLRPVFAPFLTK